MNLSNGKIYVGKSIDPTYRWKQHQHLASRGDTRPLYASLRRYGIQNFDFVVIQAFEKLEDAYAAEIYWINFWQSFMNDFGYNLTKGGIRAQDVKVSGGVICARKSMPDSMKKKLSSLLKGKKHPPEVIENMRLAQQNRKSMSLDCRQRLHDAHLGKKLNDNHKEKIRQSLTGKSKSEAHVQHIVETRKQNGTYASANRLPDQTYKDVKRLLDQGNSRSEIMRELNVSYTVVCRVAQNKVYWVEFEEASNEDQHRTSLRQ